MISVRVSDLAQHGFCGKRSKIQVFKRVRFTRGKNEAMRKGNLMHWEYSAPFGCFERRLLRHNLECAMTRGAYQKQIDDVLIRGKPDDYRILEDNGKRVVAIIEIKTTGRKRLWNCELYAAILQCRIYMWLMRDYLEKLGYGLHSRGYVEVYSQKTRELIRRQTVYSAMSDTELRRIFDEWKGLLPLKYPPLWQCKRCPKNVRLHCERYQHYFGSDKRGVFD